MSASKTTSSSESAVTRIARSREGRYEQATRGSLARLNDHSLPTFLPSAPKPRERFGWCRLAPDPCQVSQSYCVIPRVRSHSRTSRRATWPVSSHDSSSLLFKVADSDQSIAHGN